VHKDGREVWVRALTTLRRDSAGAPLYIVSAIIDLSESKRTEHELERHLHFTRALLDAIPSPVYFKDREGHYPVYNRAWEDLGGGSAESAGNSPGARPGAPRAAFVDHLRSRRELSRREDSPDALQQGELRRPGRLGCRDSSA
jgi:PAS domain-containing protein